MLDNNRKWFLLPLILVLGLSLLFALVHYSQSYLSENFGENSKPELIGKKIELVAIADHLGDERINEFKKSHPQGQVWLSFWSMACSPCLKKLPDLVKDETQDALIVPINVDPPEQLEVAEQTFKVLTKGALPFNHDGERRLTKEFNIDFLPTHMLISSDGEILKYLIGKDVPLR